MRVDGFWAGAVRYAHKVDWAVLLGQVSTEHLRIEPWDALRLAGVDRTLVQEWRKIPPFDSMGTALTVVDERYPEALRSTPWPPPVLFVEGALDALEGVAVVGTRSCTAYGRNVAHHLGVELAGGGISVVSGLARGIDAAAHRGALVRGRTVAVLGHGLTFTAPQLHVRLRKQILEGGGAVATGFADHVGPRPHTFPVRNRWIVGLCSAVVVVEAGLRSGAGITARLAIEAGRDVYAVPGPLGVSSSAGCLRLIAEGATMLDDVVGFVQAQTGRRVAKAEAWLADLFAGGSLEVVARRHGYSVVDLVTRLTHLEMQEVVVRLPGQRYGPGRRTVP